MFCFIKMFSKKSPGNDRKDAEDVILLFTDGEPRTKYRKDLDYEYGNATKFSRILKYEKNINIIGVAAGDVSSYRSNIQGWVSSPDLVFETGLGTLDTEENVNKLVEQLTGPLCCGKCSRRRKISWCGKARLLKPYQLAYSPFCLA